MSLHDYVFELVKCFLNWFIETNRQKEPDRGKESDFPSLVSWYELLSWIFYGFFFYFLEFDSP